MRTAFWKSLLAAVFLGLLQVPAAADDFALRVLSSRPDMVSGGDALIAASMPAGTKNVALTLNGRDVTAAFKSAASGSFIGLVKGLNLGKNALALTVGGAKKAGIELVNYPITGPILSGPHIAPYICQTELFALPDGSTLGPATDANCSAPTKVQYVYKSTLGTFKALTNLAKLPGDVANTTILTGASVPYVVRFEAGTIDRGVYNIAILHDPTTQPAPTPLAPPAGWSKRLLWVHGFGCPGGWYYQGTNTGSRSGMGGTRDPNATLESGFNVLNDSWLAKGYAVATSTLNHPSNSCNPILAGEATAMVKERFIEQFGAPLFTASTGGSGGAYSSLQIADAFPGLFDGVLIAAVFPDALSIGLSGLDGHLLTHFFAGNQQGWSEAQKVAVSGYAGYQAFVDAANQAGRTDPVSRKDVDGYYSNKWTVSVAHPVTEPVPEKFRYDPVKNPKGARPTIFDVSAAVYGRDPKTGFALRPFDNVGVQYGLAALNAGTISVAQFLALNERVGGYDADANYTPARAIADAGAITRAYQGGLSLSGAGGLASIPVFDYGSYNETTAYHYQWFHFAVRERLIAANGDAANMIMWRGQGRAPAESQAVFEQWMTAYASDTKPGTARDKAVRNKPAKAADACYAKTGAGLIVEPQTFGSAPDTPCNREWPSYADPRQVAGGPLAGNVLKCALKPVAAAGYAVKLTTAELARLKAIFPGGVCDWSKPGVNQRPVVPWASFGPSPVNQVFDVTTP